MDYKFITFWTIILVPIITVAILWPLQFLAAGFLTIIYLIFYEIKWSEKWWEKWRERQKTKPPCGKPGCENCTSCNCEGASQCHGHDCSGGCRHKD